MERITGRGKDRFRFERLGRPRIASTVPRLAVVSHGVVDAAIPLASRPRWQRRDGGSYVDRLSVLRCAAPTYCHREYCRASPGCRTREAESSAELAASWASSCLPSAEPIPDRSSARAAACRLLRQSRAGAPPLPLLPQGDSDGARPPSDRQLTRALIGPMHGTQRVRPSGASVGRRQASTSSAPP